MRQTIALGFVFTALVATVLTATGQRASDAAAGPPMPYEDVGACPFEGCVYREWVATAPVVVRTGRGENDPVAFTLRAGQPVQALTGIVVTTRPGRVTFRAPLDLPSTQGVVHVVPGDVLYLLTYHGEGDTTAWFKGRLYDALDGSEFFNAACEFSPDSCIGSIVEQPQRVWWVRLRGIGGRLGWSHETDKFDNKDALG